MSTTDTAGQEVPRHLEIFGTPSTIPMKDHHPHDPKHLTYMAFALAINECETSIQSFRDTAIPDPQFQKIANDHEKTKAELIRLRPMAVSAVNSYAKHCGSNAVTLAEADLLGEALAALKHIGGLWPENTTSLIEDVNGINDGKSRAILLALPSSQPVLCWPRRKEGRSHSDKSKITSAFRALRGVGFTARQSFLCCQDAHGRNSTVREIRMNQILCFITSKMRRNLERTEIL